MHCKICLQFFLLLTSVRAEESKLYFYTYYYVADVNTMTVDGGVNE